MLLSSSSYSTQNSFTDENNRFTRFYVYWALKESYIKAIGLGLGFDLKDIEFRINCKSDSASNTVSSATAKIKGVERHDWKYDNS